MSIAVQRHSIAFKDDKEEKKVDFAFDVDKLQEANFLNKLQTTVKRIDEYQSHTGTKSQGR